VYFSLQLYLITILAGGTGSIKLIRGFAALKKDLTIISNVGDNIWIYGLYVAPDIDTVLYGLSGLLDKNRGWGLKDDSFRCLAQLKELGTESWFAIGDRDLATHLLRTNMLRDGKSLSQITEWMSKQYKLTAKVIPSTDDELTTFIVTNKGKIHLQEFWVKYRGKIKVYGVEYRGASKARANVEALNAIRKSDQVIIAPGNPVSSIGPIIALNELRTELSRNRHKVVAISPLIGTSAISGPASNYLKALGISNSPIGVAQLYSDFISKFLISKSDRKLIPKILELDMQVYATNILMKNKDSEIRLSKYLLERAIYGS
jgi:LPPG:FO 2-phospho-L-lactate transferase